MPTNNNPTLFRISESTDLAPNNRPTSASPTEYLHSITTFDKTSTDNIGNTTWQNAQSVAKRKQEQEAAIQSYANQAHQFKQKRHASAYVQTQFEKKPSAHGIKPNPFHKYMPWVNPEAKPATRSPHENTHSNKLSTHDDVARSALTEEEKLRDPEYRRKVRTTKRIGHAFALLIAGIDGVITAVAMTEVTMFAVGGLPLAILVGISGFLVNRIVYWRSVPGMLHQIFIDGFFKGLSTTKKALISVSFIFAMTLGLGFASLAFKSLCAIFGLSMMTAFTASPALAIVITGLALCYFVSNTSLFFHTLSGMIRQDGHKKIAAFFKKLVTPEPGKSKVEQALISFFKVVFTLAGLALGILAAYVILGKLAVSIESLLTSTAGVATETANIVAKVLIFGLGAIARFAFSIESCVGAFAQIGKALGSLIYKLCHGALHWQESKTSIKQQWQAFKDKQKQGMKGRTWSESWDEWQNMSAEQRDGVTKNNDAIKYYTKGFKHAFSQLPGIRKAAWLCAGIWFAITIPAILVNSIGRMALGAGGAPHLHGVTEALGMSVSLNDATNGAMISSGLFSGSLGLYKYLDLTTRENNGSKKHHQPLDEARQNGVAAEENQPLMSQYNAGSYGGIFSPKDEYDFGYPGYRSGAALLPPAYFRSTDFLKS